MGVHTRSSKVRECRLASATWKVPPGECHVARARRTRVVALCCGEWCMPCEQIVAQMWHCSVLATCSNRRALQRAADGTWHAPLLAQVGAVTVVPLLSWHHASFDKEADIVGWDGIPDVRIVSREHASSTPKYRGCRHAHCSARDWRCGYASWEAAPRVGSPGHICAGTRLAPATTRKGMRAGAAGHARLLRVPLRRAAVDARRKVPQEFRWSRAGSPPGPRVVVAPLPRGMTRAPSSVGATRGAMPALSAWRATSTG